ncbi:MAG TPA: NADH-quinone oxidoreductase subunit J [Thermoanaerobaculia bacterium]|jgi:NADH-quinone oxidoreductase subunit J
MEFAIFFFFAAVAVIFALVVILHRNPVVGALSLVASFFALAVIYVLLDAPFLAALQVIVYAGAIMVLFLFVIMLLNLQHETETATRPIQQFLGYTSGAAFGIGLVYFLVKYGVTEAAPAVFRGEARDIGVTLFEKYIFPFEMVSILLLAAIVGALALTGRSYGRPRATPGREPGGDVLVATDVSNAALPAPNRTPAAAVAATVTSTAATAEVTK